MSAETTADASVIVLGASNISLGWKQLSQIVTARFPERMSILTAHGFGRAWIDTSQFALRQLPGIMGCGLWEHLETTHTAPVAALITDLGNDLVYGRDPSAVMSAVTLGIQRIRQASPNCRIVVTRPPVASVQTLGATRYRVFRTLIFPFCRLSLHEIRERTLELDQRIQDLHDVTIEFPAANWYGLDPIHVRRRNRSTAFERMLQSWPVRTSMNRQASTALSRPVATTRWVAGIHRRTPQPSVRSPNVEVFAW